MAFRFHWGVVCLAVWAWPAGAQTIAGGKCPVFPANNIWNARIDSAPLHPQSAAWVNSIGAAKPLHQDFGGTLYLGNEPGFRINLVPGTQPKVPITFREGASESDPGPYPIPAAPYIENGSDAHMLLLDTDNCILYETFDTYKDASGNWSASSGAVFSLRGNSLRPAGWTSSDAAGLPIVPGLARYEEILEGEIRHALRFTAPSTRREYLWPGRHFASYSTDPALPPMGARFRLKDSFDISPFSPTMRIILTALKRYGMMLADNGGSWFMQGTFDPRWPDLVTEFRKVPGSAFEAVDVSGLMENPDSAAVRASVTAPSLDSVALAALSVPGGQSTSLRINLTGLAPSGGTAVSLGSSNSAVAQLPAAALVPAGSSFVDVSVTTSGVASLSTASLSATVTGVARSATLSVTPPQVSAVALNPAIVAGGGSSTATVTLSGIAPAGGLTVSLTSNSASAQVPSSVLVPASQRTANFAVAARTVSVDTVAQVTAAALSSSASASLRITAPPPPPALAVTAVSVAGAPLTAGQAAASGAVTLNAAATASTTVSLSSSNPAVASVSAGSLTVAPGAAGASFSVSPLAAGTTVITATFGASVAVFTLTVNPAAPPPANSGAGGTEFFAGLPLAQYSTRTNFTGWAGIGIVTRSRFKVTRLGRIRTAGQTGLRTVALFTSWGATTPVASVQVDLGSVADGQFAYADLPGGGYQMEADRYLYIVSQESAGQPVLWTTATGVSGNPASSIAVVDRAAWKTANYDGFVPDAGVKLPHGAVNFQFTTGSVAATPAPVLSSVTLNQSSVTAGSPVTGTVTLSAPAAGNTVVTLGATGPASVGSSVTVASGQTTASFSVATTSVTTASTAVVQAALNAVTRTASLTVNPVPAAPPASAGAEFYTGLPLSQYTTRTDFTGWAGMGFISTTRFKITRLGRMRTGGQTGLRTVAIFNSWGATTPVASVQVDLGSVPDGQIAYADIPGGGYLLPGQGYYFYVVSQETAGQKVMWTTSTATASIAGVATVDRAAWKTANYDGFVPDAGIKLPHGAVNFQYTLP